MSSFQNFLITSEQDRDGRSASSSAALLLRRAPSMSIGPEAGSNETGLKAASNRKENICPRWESNHGLPTQNLVTSLTYGLSHIKVKIIIALVPRCSDSWTIHDVNTRTRIHLKTSPGTGKLVGHEQWQRNRLVRLGSTWMWLYRGDLAWGRSVPHPLVWRHEHKLSPAHRPPYQGTAGHYRSPPTPFVTYISVLCSNIILRITNGNSHLIH